MKSHSGCQRGGRDGYALAVVLILLLAMGIVGLAFLSLAGGETKLSQGDLESQRAFWLAEAGKEMALKQMKALTRPPEQDTRLCSNQTLPGSDGGTYTVDCVVDTAAIYSTLKSFVLDSVGSYGNRQRRIRQRVQLVPFSMYAYFTHDESYPTEDDIWFLTGDVVQGRIHSNGLLKILGNPRFLGPVTSSATSMKGYPNYTVTTPSGWPVGGNSPYFAEGFQLGVNSIPLPSSPTSLRTDAQNGGLLLANGTTIELGKNAAGTATAGWFRYRKTGSSGTWSATRISLMTRKVVYCDNDIALSGTLDGEMTIAGAKNINIVDDVIYKDSNAGTPLPGCNDLLGLVAGKNVMFVDNTANGSNLNVDAVMMALNTSIYAEDYDAGNPRGVLKVWGGLIQKYRGPVSQFRNGAVVHGYLKDYHYDPRVTARTPPSFPITGTYEELAWSESWDSSYPF